ncbi:hypothetical protein CEXT_80951 [Caerostris extrusa]|uniref:Uncharacterized protein n=1 Tax=Caerostris extrusa TaxID=172846 RepID=A0AAV4M3F0_CAEEX|nr:hypothetical protein CEXT_80951 [Caerostris extrusa]
MSFRALGRGMVDWPNWRGVAGCDVIMIDGLCWMECHTDLTLNLPPFSTSLSFSDTPLSPPLLLDLLLIPQKHGLALVEKIHPPIRGMHAEIHSPIQVIYSKIHSPIQRMHAEIHSPFQGMHSKISSPIQGISF